MQLIKIKNFSGGFALVELIVAVGIFLSVVSVGLGAIINLYNANNKSESLATVVNSLNYSIESMTREIRFATAYHCGASLPLTSPQNCSTGYGSGGTSDVFLAVSTSSTATIYRFVTTSGKGRIERSSDSGVSYKTITGSEANIQYVRFYVANTSIGDQYQPYVVIVIRGYVGGKPSNQTSFDIETMVSERALNI